MVLYSIQTFISVINSLLPSLIKGARLTQLWIRQLCDVINSKPSPSYHGQSLVSLIESPKPSRKWHTVQWISVVISKIMCLHTLSLDSQKIWYLARNRWKTKMWYSQHEKVISPLSPLAFISGITTLWRRTTSTPKVIQYLAIYSSVYYVAPGSSLIQV